METVTYILGAGASAGRITTKHGAIDRSTIPLVGEFSKRMNQQIAYLDETFKKKEVSVDHYLELPNLYPNYYVKDVLNHYFKSLKTLIAECQKHASIDTYARRLFLKNAPDLKGNAHDLKAALCTFLTIEQIINGIDIRYDSLLATVLKSNDGILTSPLNFKIFSWNYDQQFEIAHWNYFEPIEKEIDNYIKNHQIDTISNPLNFFFIKLNGNAILNTARIFSETHTLDNSLLFQYREFGIISEEQASMQSIMTHDLANDGGRFGKSSLKFSWENMDETIQKIESTEPGLRDCKQLVIIGYSFPLFNHQIDKEIIKCLPNLEKVFIQVPRKNYLDIKQRLERYLLDHPNKDIITITNIENLDSFFIPNEVPI